VLPARSSLDPLASTRMVRAEGQAVTARWPRSPRCQRTAVCALAAQSRESVRLRSGSWPRLRSALSARELSAGWCLGGISDDQASPTRFSTVRWLQGLPRARVLRLLVLASRKIEIHDPPMVGRRAGYGEYR
jgi:hypothetical protein